MAINKRGYVIKFPYELVLRCDGFLFYLHFQSLHLAKDQYHFLDGEMILKTAEHLPREIIRTRFSELLSEIPLLLEYLKDNILNEKEDYPYRKTAFVTYAIFQESCPVM